MCALVLSVSLSVRSVVFCDSVCVCEESVCSVACVRVWFGCRCILCVRLSYLCACLCPHVCLCACGRICVCVQVSVCVCVVMVSSVVCVTVSELCCAGEAVLVMSVVCVW